MVKVKNGLGDYVEIPLEKLRDLSLTFTDWDAEEEKWVELTFYNNAYNPPVKFKIKIEKDDSDGREGYKVTYYKEGKDVGGGGYIDIFNLIWDTVRVINDISFNLR